MYQEKYSGYVIMCIPAMGKAGVLGPCLAVFLLSKDQVPQEIS
jgi:hypothetical protein